METQILVSSSSAEYKNTYERRNHAIGKSIWHMQWCTKYRLHMFRKEKCAKLIEACIRRSASMNGIKIVEISIMSDHVHCVVELRLAMSPSKATQILKGGSSYLFFKYQPKTRLRYPKRHLWSRGKFAASVGFIQVETAREYVRNQ